MESITIPASVTHIGGCAFKSQGLKKAYFAETDGWTKTGCLATDYDGPVGTPKSVDSSVLADPLQAAAELQKLYSTNSGGKVGYVWQR